MLSSTPFFSLENGLYIGNQGARGPWSDDACHAGPPSAAFARELELLTDKQLIRLQVNLLRPVPMAGFHIAATIEKEGRSTAYAKAEIIDTRGKLCAQAQGLFHTLVKLPSFDALPESTPDFTPVEQFLRDGENSSTVKKGRQILPAKNGFALSVEPVSPADTPITSDEGAIPGVTRSMWMRTPQLITGESMSGFQRICPLSDCINALSANLDIHTYNFMNTDLTIALHRIPEDDAEWFGITASAHCQTNGLGLSCGNLYDQKGNIGTVLQNLLLRAN